MRMLCVRWRKETFEFSAGKDKEKERKRFFPFFCLFFHQVSLVSTVMFVHALYKIFNGHSGNLTKDVKNLG